jgi:hypothetical protein
MDATSIILGLHLDRTGYSIGESIRPKLRIQNRTPRRIVFNTGFAFDWERLAFAGPNAVHLIDPDGKDLALPYRRDPAYFESIEPTAVEAGKDEWLFLPISAHFQLRKPGTYSFRIELSDDGKNAHKSNEVSFDLSDVGYSVAPHTIGLSLRSTRQSFAAGESVEIEAEFINNAEKALLFLKPQEDSPDGWVNPVYRFTVTDSAGRNLAMPLRCGSMAEPVYDEKTRFLIEPGGKHSMAMTLPRFPGLKQPGEYRLQLTYIVREKAIGKGGDLLDRVMQWDTRTFIGRIESGAILISIK